MEVFEYYAQVSENGQITLPDELRKHLRPEKQVRIMIFLEKEELEWKNLSAVKFFQGYAEKDNIYDNL